MANRIEFDASGFEQFNALVLDVLGSLADEIVEDAKNGAPVASGKLRDSIHKGEADKESQTVPVVADAAYAAFVEEGSAHHKARPFLKPAAYKTREIKA